MSQIPDTDWRINLQVSHPTFSEPPVMRERRVLRHIGYMLAVNHEDIGYNEFTKITKILNTRLLAILNEARPERKEL